MKSLHLSPLPFLLLLVVAFGCATSPKKKKDPFGEVKREAGQSIEELDKAVEQRKGQELQKKN